ncbi:hypothetical protein D3C81_1255690 [compost metagenome]
MSTSNIPRHSALRNVCSARSSPRDGSNTAAWLPKSHTKMASVHCSLSTSVTILDTANLNRFQSASERLRVRSFRSTSMTRIIDSRSLSEFTEAGTSPGKVQPLSTASNASSFRCSFTIAFAARSLSSLPK